MAGNVQTTISHCPLILDDRPVPKRIGLIVLATDHTTERDFARYLEPDEVGVYCTRIAFDNPTTPENLRKTGPRLTEAAAKICPGEELDAIVYACTSASVVLGDETVEKHLNTAKPDTPCITPSTAALEAFAALGVQKISILTSYTVDVTDELVRYFTSHGLDIVSSACLGISDDRNMARVSETSIIEAGIATFDHRADALFISCTALRAAQCARHIETALGKPVVTSNQAMIWNTLRHLGLQLKATDEGSILHRT